jgi:hypothetical protein
MLTDKGKPMKDRLWTFLLVSLIFVFWVFVLAGPLVWEKQPRSHYALFVANRTGVCIP